GCTDDSKPRDAAIIGCVLVANPLILRSVPSTSRKRVWAYGEGGDAEAARRACRVLGKPTTEHAASSAGSALVCCSNATASRALGEGASRKPAVPCIPAESAEDRSTRAQASNDGKSALSAIHVH